MPKRKGFAKGIDEFDSGGFHGLTGRHILDFENEDLALPALRFKYRAAKEGHDEYLAEIVARDILRRTHSR